MSNRIARRFAALRDEGRAGLVAFVTAGDPDPETGTAILARLPAAGADIVELGMPFTDPMADGPAIQESSLRALRAGMTLKATLAMVARFREEDAETPVVLMGYFNPILNHGVAAFVRDAAAAGVDGLIVVDLPPEEDAELREPATAAGIAIVRLTTPTTDGLRLPRVLAGASGFLYHVAVAGVTGGKSADAEDIARALAPIRAATSLPLAVGFGIRTPEQAAAIARIADAAVVGSAIVAEVKAHLDDDGRAGPNAVDAVADLVRALATAVRQARCPDA